MACIKAFNVARPAPNRSQVVDRKQKLRQRHPAQSTREALPERIAQLASTWLEQDADAATRQHIQQLVDAQDAAELQQLLGQRLQFGTAGLRGLMGPGYNRMNMVTVQQTSQGLLRYLQQQDPVRLQRRGLAVGYDARHNSRQFALLTAACAVAEGVPVWLFSQPVPTPFVPAAVQQLGCAAGVVVTASHNPAMYNGFKVYWSNACQIIPPHDAGIAAAIEGELALWQVPPLESIDYSHPLVQDPLQQVADAYYARLKRHVQFRDAEANGVAPRMVYTALHGVGTPWVLRAFQEFALPPPLLVRQQCDPDADFPTVAFPNPEEGEGAWALAFEAAEAAGASLALANDPDADRFAVAERDQATGRWRAFTGNEIGAMLAEWVVRNHRQRHGHPDDKLAVLSSTVSSRMLQALAAKEGAYWAETLTGFKWLGNEALKLETAGFTVLFAHEEAIGFMLGAIEKDKDGVSAAVAAAELAADVYARGQTLAQHWEALRQWYGSYEYRSGHCWADPPSKSAAVFERLRAQVPQSIGGSPVLGVRDLGTGVDTAQPDGRAVLPWQPGDMMITYRLEGAVVTVRASGTEPKLKYYLEAFKEVAAQSRLLADNLEAAVQAELVQPELHGLRRPSN